MIPIDDDLPYKVLKDGDGLQVIHECGNRVLIGFTDPTSGKNVLAWVSSEYVRIEGKPENEVDRHAGRAHIRLAYSAERGIIDTHKDHREWTTSKRSWLDWLRVGLLLVVAMLAIML